MPLLAQGISVRLCINNPYYGNITSQRYIGQPRRLRLHHYEPSSVGGSPAKCYLNYMAICKPKLLLFSQFNLTIGHS